MPYDLGPDLAAARTEANEFLFSTASVRRPTTTRGASGAAKQVYAEVPGMEAVPVNLKDIQTAEVVVADRLTTHVTATLEAVFGTDIRETDRVVVGGFEWEVVTDRTDPLGAYNVYDVERAE